MLEPQNKSSLIDLRRMSQQKNNNRHKTLLYSPGNQFYFINITLLLKNKNYLYNISSPTEIVPVILFCVTGNLSIEMKTHYYFIFNNWLYFTLMQGKFFPKTLFYTFFIRSQYILIFFMTITDITVEKKRNHS